MLPKMLPNRRGGGRGDRTNNRVGRKRFREPLALRSTGHRQTTNERPTSDRRARMDCTRVTTYINKKTRRLPLHTVGLLPENPLSSLVGLFYQITRLSISFSHSHCPSSSRSPSRTVSCLSRFSGLIPLSFHPSRVPFPSLLHWNRDSGTNRLPYHRKWKRTSVLYLFLLFELAICPSPSPSPNPSPSPSSSSSSSSSPSPTLAPLQLARASRSLLFVSTTFFFRSSRFPRLLRTLPCKQSELFVHPSTRISASTLSKTRVASPNRN